MVQPRVDRAARRRAVVRGLSERPDHGRVQSHVTTGLDSHQVVTVKERSEVIKSVKVRASHAHASGAVNQDVAQDPSSGTIKTPFKSMIGNDCHGCGERMAMEGWVDMPTDLPMVGIREFPTPPLVAFRGGRLK